MNAAIIQFRLKLRGIQQKEIAAHLGVTPAFISQVINGKRRSAKVEKALAKFTGIPRQALFPELAA